MIARAAAVMLPLLATHLADSVTATRIREISEGHVNHQRDR
jgi:hypothetical protein